MPERRYQEPQLNLNRRRLRDLVGDEKGRALLGDGSGNLYVKAEPGKVWVRSELKSLDSDGISTYGQPEPVLGFSDISSPYPVREGVRVIIARDSNGQLAVKGIDGIWAQAQRFNLNVLNSANPQVYGYGTTEDFTPLLATPYAAGSLSVAVRSFIYRDVLGDVQHFSGTTVDLTSYVPATTGAHLRAQLWLNIDNTVTVTTSTEQSTLALLDMTDVQETFDSAPASSLPIRAFRLYQGMTEVTDNDKLTDMRQRINLAANALPVVPYTISKDVFIPYDMQTSFPAGVAVQGGALIVQGIAVIG